MSKKKVIYFYAGLSSFVRGDLDILREKYELKTFEFDQKNKKLTPIVYLKQFFYLLKNIFSTDLMIVMFGGHPSLLPALFGKVFRKPCLIITGGTDCVSFPSIGYGNFNKKILGLITKWSYKLAAHIAPVHKSLVEYNYTYQDEDFPKQGYAYHCPGIKTPFTEINYGYDHEKWTISTDKIKDSFITVAAGLDQPYRSKLKGVDLILEIAPYFPEAKFTIIGCPENYKLPVKSNNITVYSFITNEQLKDFFNKHEFYIQVSMSEGFPNAICEAMVCGSIPIGSKVGGIPDIIGDAGFILERRDSKLFKDLVEKALNCDRVAYSAKARERIMTKYPKDLRKIELLRLTDKLMSHA